MRSREREEGLWLGILWSNLNRAYPMISNTTIRPAIPPHMSQYCSADPFSAFTSSAGVPNIVYCPGLDMELLKNGRVSIRLWGFISPIEGRDHLTDCFIRFKIHDA